MRRIQTKKATGVIKVDNYMKNYDFYLLMTDYLSEGRALREIYTSSDYMLQFRVTRFLENCENRGFNEAMTEIIRQLESRGYLSEKRHEQFCIAKEAADRRAGTDAEAVFKLLYTTTKQRTTFYKSGCPLCVIGGVLSAMKICFKRGSVQLDHFFAKGSRR